jgi:hypothetical protein
MAREAIPKQLQDDIFDTFGFETGIGKCWCCGYSPLRRCDVFLGHIIAHKHGGAATFDNLRPICRNCNLLGDKTENAYERKLRFTDGMEYVDDDNPYKGMTRRDFLLFLQANIKLPPSYTYNGWVKTIIEHCGQYANFQSRDMLYSDFQVTGQISQSAVILMHRIYTEKQNLAKIAEQDIATRLFGMKISPS